MRRDIERLPVVTDADNVVLERNIGAVCAGSDRSSTGLINRIVLDLQAICEFGVNGVLRVAIEQIIPQRDFGYVGIEPDRIVVDRVADERRDSGVATRRHADGRVVVNPIADAGRSGAGTVTVLVAEGFVVLRK